MQLRKIGMCEVMKVKVMEDGFNTMMINQLWRRNGIVSQHEIWQNAEVIVYQHGCCVTTKIFMCNNNLFLCNKSFKMSITCFLRRILWFLKITSTWIMSVLFLQSIRVLILQSNLWEQRKMWNARLSKNANKFKVENKCSYTCCPALVSFVIVSAKVIL